MELAVVYPQSWIYLFLPPQYIQSYYFIFLQTSPRLLQWNVGKFMAFCRVDLKILTRIKQNMVLHSNFRMKALDILKK